jgi:hypothetical protein
MNLDPEAKSVFGDGTVLPIIEARLDSDAMFTIDTLAGSPQGIEGCADAVIYTGMLFPKLIAAGKEHFGEADWEVALMFAKSRACGKLDPDDVPDALAQAILDNDDGCPND